jgi:hypothetical protein
MKFLSAFILLPLLCNAAIVPVDDLITKITNLQQQASAKQAVILRQILSLRTAASSVAFNYKNGYVTLSKNSVKEISLLDIPTRTTLNSQTPSACITNLVNFLDQIEELSGYALSLCIEEKSGWNYNLVNLSNDLDNIEQDLDGLLQTILDGLIGRNAYTEPDSIIARQQELFEQRLELLSSRLNSITTEFENKQTEIEEYTYADEKVCFDNVKGQVNAGLQIVVSQLNICTSFNGRGQRASFILKANELFPQLTGRV